MKKLIKIIFNLLLIISLTSCSASKRYMTYTVYPVGYLLSRIGGNRIETISIQENKLVQTANIVSDYAEILDDTNTFFHIGDLEPYLTLYADEIENRKINSIDLSTLNAIYKFQRYTLVYVDGKETYIESPYYTGDIFNSIDTYEQDLCLWIDPIGMLSMGKDIYSFLSNNYVEQASYFKANYEALESDLISLDAAYQNLAKQIKKANTSLKFVTMTPSFGSWQKDYGFQVYPVCLSRYGALPSDAELEIIKQRIVSDGVEYIAFEPNMSDEMINLFTQLESELSLKRINLSNLSSLTPTQLSEGKDYLSIMYENLNVLQGIANNLIENNNQDSDTDESNEEITEDNQETLEE